LRFGGNKETRPYTLMGHWLIYWIIVVGLTLFSSIHYYRNVSYWIVTGVVFIVLITLNIFSALRKKPDARRRKAYREKRKAEKGGDTAPRGD
jgi:magnesium-transporting ATPase (P-type)